MYAVLVRVTVSDTEGAEQRLREEVVPQVSSAPGFQAGYWTREGNSGLSMVIFDSEENARAGAQRVEGGVPEGVTLEGVEVREVVASA
jgi:heme-degrading monooxygenase HmoA